VKNLKMPSHSSALEVDGVPEIDSKDAYQLESLPEDWLPALFIWLSEKPKTLWSSNNQRHAGWK